MRVFIAVIVLIFSFQSWTKADDISDFEIEGFYLGKSLLDYYPQEKIMEEINSAYSYTYPDKKFTILGLGYGNIFPLSLPDKTITLSPFFNFVSNLTIIILLVQVK